MSDVALEGFGGGGGTALNFNVKDYATEELLMAATGKDNEIGIITSTPMTGWYMAAEQPEEMAEGEVWISTGTASQVAFNVLKKGTVMVYPISAKQMQGGTLVDVTAKSWQNGDWVEWITLLDLNSGWIQAASGYGWSGGSVVCGERLTLTNKSYAHMVAAVKETVIDFTEIETITAVIDSDSSGLTNGKNRLAIVNSTSISWNPGTGGLGLPQEGYVAGIEFNTPGEITLDTSEIQGQYYVAILATAEKTVYCSRISY